MTRKIIFSVCISPVIYLIIAMSLSLFPVQREHPAKSLDFSALSERPMDHPDFQLEQFSGKDGKKITFRSILGEQNLVIALLHGSGSEGRYLQGLAQQLGRKLDATVILPDLRGHGLSMLSKPGDVDYLGQYEDDLEALHKHLKSTYPNARLVLGGHSSGGGLALKYSGGDLPAYDAYLLLAPYLSYKAATTRPNSGGWVQVAKGRYAGLSMLNNVGITRLNSQAVLFFNRPQKMNDALQLQSYSYRLNESFAPQDFAADLQHNTKPILVLVGAEDEAFYAQEFSPLFRVHAPRATVEVIGGATHLSLIDDGRTAERISDWLDGLFQGSVARR
ncbi:MAG: alpha/beta fold hydrolase [Halioglobus sp.]